MTDIKFIVAVKHPEIFEAYFNSSIYVTEKTTLVYFNKEGLPLPKIYNKAANVFLNQDIWLIFCHQDFILKENLSRRLENKNKKAVYGPIGVRLAEEGFFGQIMNTDGSLSGTFLTEDVSVQTLDAQCLIIHASIFKEGLRFDERFRFHFYDADICMQAHQAGLEVKAMQLDCQHKSKTLTGDVASEEYFSSLAAFRGKWTSCLPIKTSTTLVTRRHRAKTMLTVAKKTVQGLSLTAKLQLGATVKPTHLWLETTDRCNSRCTTCNIWKKPHTTTNQLLTLDELKRCLHDLVMSEVHEVLNSGGESTLINLEDYLKIEHEAFPNASLQISSNALLPERLRQTVEYAMKIGVQHLDVGLSIDGVTAKTHDAVRGVPGNFVKLEASIALMKQLERKYPNRIFTSMGSTLTDVTAKSAQELYAYSRKVCVPFMWHWPNLSSFYENEQKLIATVAGIKDVVFNYPAQNLYMDMWRQSLRTGRVPKFRCLALQRFLVIRCNGDVVPCLSKWNEVIGNIKRQSISEVWSSQCAKVERQKIAECAGCLNSWGVLWSINETYLSVLKDVIKRKMR